MPEQIGRSGQIAVHRDGEAIVLGERKADDTGWRLYGHRDGGISDAVLASDLWQLVDGRELFNLLTQIAALDHGAAGGDGYGDTTDA